MLSAVGRWYQKNRIKPVKAGLAISRLLRDPDDTGRYLRFSRPCVATLRSSTQADAC